MRKRADFAGNKKKVLAKTQSSQKISSCSGLSCIFQYLQFRFRIYSVKNFFDTSRYGILKQIFTANRRTDMSADFSGLRLPNC